MSAINAATEPWWHEYTRRRPASAPGPCSAGLGDGRGGRPAVRDACRPASGGGSRSPAPSCPDPDLLLLDEPAASLDLAARETLLADLTRLAAAPRPAAIVLVSHHVEEIPPGFDRALVLAGGRAVAAGPDRRRSSAATSCPRRSGCRCSSSTATVGLTARLAAGVARHASVTRRAARSTRDRCIDARDRLAAARTSPAAVAGIAATAVALGVSELLAGLLAGRDLARRRRRPARRSTFSRRAPRTSSSRCSAPTTSSRSSSSSSSSRWPSGPASGSSPGAAIAAAALVFAAFGVVGFLAALRDPLASPAIAGSRDGRLGRRRACGS